MFGIHFSEQSKTRHDAKNWLHLADKVVHYRRDQVPQPELHAILQAANDLKNRLAERADAARLKIAIERLEGCLRRSGGPHYPKSGLADNLEFALVALILFLGIRAFFVQPFKIPTNSMWPTYFGMTSESYPTVEDEPGGLMRLARLAVFGATAKRVDAPRDGELFIAMPYVEGGVSHARPVRGRRFGVFPATVAEYVFVVDGVAASLTVPLDFDAGRIFRDAVRRGEGAGGNGGWLPDPRRGTDRYVTTQHGGGTMRLVPTGRRVRAGERIVSFDLLTGDQLFVDRVSYHFVPPSVGDAFVFRTDNIPEIGGRNANSYYIKRLAGVPGDELEIRSPVLYRNGEPIKGAEAFEKNAQRIDRYTGYTHNGPYLAAGSVLRVPEGRFVALGDNSANSADSRSWGFVPAADVVGRPLFIYYPFSRRWGPAR